MESAPEIYRPEVKEAKAVEYTTTAELQARKNLTDAIVRNIRYIVEGAPPLAELEELEKRLAGIAASLRIIADDSIVQELKTEQ